MIEVLDFMLNIDTVLGYLSVLSFEVTLKITIFTRVKYKMLANLLCVDTVRPCPPYLFGTASSLSVAQLWVAKKDDLIDRIVANYRCLID